MVIAYLLVLFSNSTNTGQLEKRDLQSEIDKINQKVEDAKFGVAKFLEQHYSEFNPLLVHSRELAETSGCLKEAVEQLILKAETEVLFKKKSFKLQSFSIL